MPICRRNSLVRVSLHQVKRKLKDTSTKISPKLQICLCSASEILDSKLNSHTFFHQRVAEAFSTSTFSLGSSRVQLPAVV